MKKINSRRSKFLFIYKGEQGFEPSKYDKICGIEEELVIKGNS